MLRSHYPAFTFCDRIIADKTRAAGTLVAFTCGQVDALPGHVLGTNTDFLYYG